MQTTGGWSEFWLNDAPLSRRPWLHRPRHAEIDAILQAEQARTRFDERRHPEDFSGRWSGAFTNMQWGVPPRNPHFTGRRATLERIASGLNAPGERDSAAGQQGVTTLELVGMGGVGKTQLAVEFCHRHYAAAKPDAAGGASSSGYSVVIWLRAETAEVLAADLRALAADCGIGGVQGLRNEEVVAEVRSRLHRTRGAWLLVFDNVASRELLEAHLPRGCHGAGHVLVTTRELVERSSPLLLDCFAPDESLELLRRAGGDALDIDEPLKGGGGSAGAAVAEKLGHLPLALAIAAAYMRACDVPCSAYLRKLSSTRAAPKLDGTGAADALRSYATGVADSFSLSLAQVDRDATASAAAGGSALVVAPRRVLDVLAFAAPEAISRELVAEAVRAILLEAAAAPADAAASAAAPPAAASVALAPAAVLPAAAAAAAALAAALALGRSRRLAGAAAVVAVATAAAALAAGSRRGQASGANGAAQPAAAVHPCCCRRWRPPPAVVGGGRQRRRGGVSRGRVRRGGRRRRMDEAQGLLTPAVRKRQASIHRLLSAQLRASLAPPAAARAVAACCWALERSWGFDAADTTTWSAAAAAADHVRALGAHTRALLSAWPKHAAAAAEAASKPAEATEAAALVAELQLRVSALLTEGALCALWRYLNSVRRTRRSRRHGRSRRRLWRRRRRTRTRRARHGCGADGRARSRRRAR